MSHLAKVILGTENSSNAEDSESLAKIQQNKEDKWLKKNPKLSFLFAQHGYSRDDPHTGRESFCYESNCWLLYLIGL